MVLCGTVEFCSVFDYASMLLDLYGVIWLLLLSFIYSFLVLGLFQQSARNIRYCFWYAH